MHSTQKRKRNVQRDTLENNVIDGEEILNNSNVLIYLVSIDGKSKSKYYNYKDIIPAVEAIIRDKQPHKWVMSKSNFFSYHPFFDLDTKLPMSTLDWNNEVKKAISIIKRYIGDGAAVYTREENKGVHIVYPNHRIDYSHLLFLWKEMKKTFDVRSKFIIDLPGNFPLPYTSKTGSTFYKLYQGDDVEPFLIADEKFQYVEINGSTTFKSIRTKNNLLKYASVSNHIDSNIWDMCFTDSSPFSILISKTISATHGVFTVKQIIQHYMHYGNYFSQLVYFFCSIINPDERNIIFESIAKILRWKKYNLSLTLGKRVKDIFDSIAIVFFHIPDIMYGNIETKLDEIFDLDFKINGYLYYGILEKRKKQIEDNFIFDSSKNEWSIEAIIPYLFVFYQSTKYIKLYDGCVWIDVTKDCVLTLIRNIGRNYINETQAFGNISGKYCRVGFIPYIDYSIFLKNGGMVCRSSLLEFVPPLFVLAEKNCSIELDDYLFGMENKNDLFHILSEISINCNCNCKICTSTSLKMQSAIEFVHFTYKLLCCDYKLTIWFIKLIALMSFKIEGKNIIIFLGPTAGNGKTVFIDIWAMCMGQYMLPISRESVEKPRKEIATDISIASHCSIVYIDDAVDETPMNAGSIKSLTGGSKQFVRGIYQSTDLHQSIKFNIVMTANKPLVTTADYGVFNRLLNIPFEIRFETKNSPLFKNFINESRKEKIARIKSEFLANSFAHDSEKIFSDNERELLAQGMGITFSAVINNIHKFQDSTIPDRVTKFFMDKSGNIAKPTRDITSEVGNTNDDNNKNKKRKKNLDDFDNIISIDNIP